MKRTAFTLLELVVVLAIVGLLLALLLPAVQYARETSRRTMCASNLRQMMLAVHAYQTAHKIFPPGGNAQGFSLHVAILPYTEQPNLHSILGVNESAPLSAEHLFANPPPLPNPVIYNCPSDYVYGDVYRPKATSYAGNYGTGMQDYGYNGAFRKLLSDSTKWPEGPMSPGMIGDGLSNTAFLAEALVSDGSWRKRRMVFQTRTVYFRQGESSQFAQECRGGNYVTQNNQPLGDPWMRGRPWLRGDAGFTLYNHVLRPNEPSCTNSSLVQEGAYSASSNHPGGVQVAYGDCRISFVADSVNAVVWHALGSRDGNEPTTFVP